MSTPKFDWTAVRARLEASQAALDAATLFTPEESQGILEERAVALARTTDREDPRASLEVVEFTLAGENCAIESTYVAGIATLTSLTPIPCTPPFVLGVTVIRGELVAVLDLRTLFDFPPRGISNLDSVLVLRANTSMFAIVADAIGGVRHIPLDGLQAELPTLTGIRERYLRGITADRRVVLDGEAILSDQSLVVRAQVK